MSQTIGDFLAKPFGKSEPKQNDYEASYKKLASQKRVFMQACTKVDEKNFLVHIKVGSESRISEFYDVVILFYTHDSKIARQIRFTNYFVKFFSNSPSFIYKYAVLYKEKGMMIPQCAMKLDQQYADKLPEKSNPNMIVSYDKSIYIACRFMLDHKVSAFNRFGVMARDKKDKEKFFSDIKNFEDVKFDAELDKLGKQLEKESAKSTDETDVKGKRPQKGKMIATATKAPAVKTVKKITGNSSTTAVKRAKKAKRL